MSLNERPREIAACKAASARCLRAAVSIAAFACFSISTFRCLRSSLRCSAAFVVLDISTAVFLRSDAERLPCIAFCSSSDMPAMPADRPGMVA